MIEHRFICDNCGFVLLDINTKIIHKCQNCNVDLRWDLCNLVTIDEHPRYSRTLGVPENQIEDAMKLHPGTEWKKFGNSYRPLIKNRTDKLRLMKEANYEEYDPESFKGR